MNSSWKNFLVSTLVESFALVDLIETKALCILAALVFGYRWRWFECGRCRHQQSSFTGQIKLCKFALYLIYTLPSIARMVSWSI